MAERQYALINNLSDILAETLHHQEGVKVDTIEVERVVNRAFSDVVFLRLTTSTGERKLVLKKTVHNPVNKSITENENQAVVEFNILSELYPKFKSVPRCNVPRPILVMPDHEAYVMDFVDGRLLGELFAGAKILAPRKAFEELIEYYFLCGVWLKKLQEFTGIRRAGFAAFSNTLERCEVRLKLIDNANDPRCPIGITKRIRNFLDEQLSLVKEEDILVTGRHGDFGSWNIMAGPDGITVFDFLGYQDDLLPIDLLKMMMNFEIEKTYLFFSKHRIETLKKSFLLGYGEIPRISMPILAISETLHRVCNMYAIVIAKSGNILRLAENNKALKANLSWLNKIENDAGYSSLITISATATT